MRRSPPHSSSPLLCHHVFALLLLATPPACGSAPLHRDEVAAAATPMAPFARMVGGSWEVVFPDGSRARQAWHWGPGRHSLRKTAGRATGGDDPWACEVVYWHPGRHEIRVLSLHEDIPGVGRGVGTGSMTFDGVTARADVALQQTRGLRQLQSRWTFDGPDTYRDELLEDTGRGFAPLAAWQFTRVAKEAAGAAAAPGAAPRPDGRMAIFGALVGRTWTAVDGAGAPAPGAVQSTCTWLPGVDVVHIVSTGRGPDDEPSRRLDAYVHAPIGNGPLRCLALTHDGAVYEGDVRALDGGSLQFDLVGSPGDRDVRCAVRLDVAADGSVRQRVWSGPDAAQVLRLDRHHRRDGGDRSGK